VSSQILEYLTSVFLVDDEVLIVKVADFQLLSRGENRTFRASMKSVKERKWLWLLKVENWEFMLRVESGKLHLLRCSKRSCQTRGMLLGVGWPVLALVQAFIPWKYTLSQSADAIDSVVSALPGLAGLERFILFLVLYALVASGFFIVLFYFGTFGILCLLDILTIRLQARFGVDIALLKTAFWGFSFDCYCSSRSPRICVGAPRSATLIGIRVLPIALLLGPYVLYIRRLCLNNA